MLTCRHVTTLPVCRSVRTGQSDSCFGAILFLLYMKLLQLVLVSERCGPSGFLATSIPPAASPWHLEIPTASLQAFKWPGSTLLLAYWLSDMGGIPRDSGRQCGATPKPVAQGIHTPCPTLGMPLCGPSEPHNSYITTSVLVAVTHSGAFQRHGFEFQCCKVRCHHWQFWSIECCPII